ncbi:MAG TPA: hypothetical protein VHO02_09520 [Fibrobacteria bacterium]|nr:hypothetical protein [Fibrobacteria bacterium]
MQPERILVGVLLLFGFLWLRLRARKLDEAGRSRAYKGILLFVIPVLLGGRWAFDRLPFGKWENAFIEMAVLAAAIAFAGFVFMPEAKKTEGTGPS